MSRTARHGEWKFGEICQAPDVKAEVVVNRASDDQNGWDHVIDIVPPKQRGLPEDLQTHLIQCFAQIKTTVGPVARAKLKLSNAVKAAKSPFPCFVFLLFYQNGSASPKIYGRHVWRREILHWLRRAREAGVRGRHDLHKLSVTIPFADGDQIADENPINWMLAVLKDCGGESYSRNKLALVEGVGYEDFLWEASVSFGPISSMDDIVDHELGLVDSLPFSDFVAFDKRFGIKSELPLVSAGSGRARFMREGREITLQIQSADGEVFDIPALGWMPTLVDFEDPAFRFRVKAGHIEIIAYGTEAGGKFDLIKRPDEAHSLLQHLGLLRLIRWSRVGAVKFRVLTDIGQLFSGTINARLSQDPWNANYEVTLSHVVDLLTRERCREICVSLSDLSELNRDFHFIAAIFQASHFRVRLEVEREAERVNKLIGYACIEVASWSAGAIYELDCESQNHTGGWQEFTFCNPKIIRTFVFRRPLSELREHVLLEFSKYRGANGAKVVTFQEGDFVDWARVLSERGALTMTVSD